MDVSDFPCRKNHAGPFLATPEAQCLGERTCEYALIPHAGDWQVALAQAHAFNVPLRAVVTDVRSGSLLPTDSRLHLEQASFVITAVKRTEAGDGVIVRGFNVGTAPIDVRLRLNGPARSIYHVNLAEEHLESLDPNTDGWVRVPVKPRQIIALKFSWIY